MLIVLTESDAAYAVDPGGTGYAPSYYRQGESDKHLTHKDGQWHDVDTAYIKVGEPMVFVYPDKARVRRTTPVVSVEGWNHPSRPDEADNFYYFSKEN